MTSDHSLVHIKQIYMALKKISSHSKATSYFGSELVHVGYQKGLAGRLSYRLSLGSQAFMECQHLSPEKSLVIDKISLECEASRANLRFSQPNLQKWPH